MHDPFSLKMKQLGIPAEDLASFGGVNGRTCNVVARADIAVSGRSTGNVHILVDGWASKYKMMCDGRRQILAFRLPGDICDLERLFEAETSVGVTALTDCKVAAVSTEWLIEARNSRPAVRDLLWSLLAREHATMTEQIVALGRRTSRQRIAYFLCDLLERLQAVGLAEDDCFRAPLTQTDMADALGLSTVHVNRTLQALREDGLIEMRGRNFRVSRRAELKRAASYEREADAAPAVRP